MVLALSRTCPCLCQSAHSPTRATGRKFIPCKMAQSPSLQCDAAHSMAQGQGCANRHQGLGLPNGRPEPIDALRAVAPTADTGGGGPGRLPALALHVVNEGDG